MKSQIEIMGLIVIVILVAIGFFVYIVLVINKPVEDPVEEFSTDQLAQNFVSSMVKTQTTCQLPLDRVIQDCMLEQNLNCTGESACMVANQTIIFILNKTVNTWGYPYILTIPQMHLEYTNKKCDANSERGTQGFELVTLYGRGDVLITMDVCR